MRDETFFRRLNVSVEAPTEGVYRYQLIPSEIPSEGFYIDIWYQFAMGMDKDQLLEHFEDAVYLEEGEKVALSIDNKIEIVKRKNHLKLVVNNG